MPDCENIWGDDPKLLRKPIKALEVKKKNKSKKKLRLCLIKKLFIFRKNGN